MAEYREEVASSGQPSDNQPSLPIYRRDGRALGVLVEHVSAYGANMSSQTVSDLPAILYDLALLPVKTFRAIEGIFGKKKTLGTSQTIIDDVSAVIYPGETVLVLGRPGAGCSSVLKVLANNLEAFQTVQGLVEYAGISSQEMSEHFQSEVVYNAEDDIHFPRLKVKQTMEFALRARQPRGDTRSTGEFVGQLTDQILESLGLSHTKNTIVGDAFVRGVSGGERKRVSLAEVLAVNPALACWDNPIRGLDSSSALSFIRLVRDMSRRTGMANAVTLYQASDSMYEMFDRVLVMYEGQMIFFGAANSAKHYFESLGFHALERQTIPEFLTGITSPAERLFRPSKDQQTLLTEVNADSLAKAFRNSSHYGQLQQDIARYREQVSSDESIRGAFKAAAQSIRSRASVKTAIEPAAIWTQTLSDIRRQYQLKWGERRILYTVFILTAINAVVTASAYYHAPATATGSYERSGALFFSLIYFSLNAMTEVSKTVHSREILLKQHKLGFLHPSAFVLAQTLADIPIAFLQSLVFACCYYFTVGLENTASNFWIFVLIVFAHFCTISSLFRMLGAWSPNLSVALLAGGSALPVICVYSGFAPTIPTMHRWGSWIRRTSPSPFGMEALMSNEFSKLVLECTSSELVPSGQGYENSTLHNQGCPMAGAQPGSNTVPGSIYLSAKYGYEWRNLWRDFGIIIAMWVIYVLLTAIGLGIMTRDSSTSSARVFKKGAFKWGRGPKKPAFLKNEYAGEKDPEDPGEVFSSTAPTALNSPIGGSTATLPALAENSKHLDYHAGTFVFKDVNYFVNVAGQEKRLLQDVTGYVRPGQLTALMGASGAGKSTLLETISQRKAEGRTEGDLRLGGEPLGLRFAQSCGFCMQQDVHEPTATVREALRFSAQMRQEAHIPEDEKLRYADDVLELLELESIADALVGSLGVEERKRVTIGVELAARPSALLFLDEPTSGLDSQAAFSIVSCLQKIAAQGIPIVCTIHQPSGIIFSMFDHVLILAPGGRTIYFGETGLHSSVITDYFARNGATMSESDNPAEFIISTVAAKEKDWPQLWTSSPEKEILDEKVIRFSEKPKGSVKAMTSTTTTTPPIEGNQQFALSTTRQTILLLKRHWLAVWRNGPYNFSKLFKSCFFMLFMAFTFFHVGQDVQGLQNHGLALLLGSWIIPTIAADIQAIWFEKWAIFEARERNGIYSYKSLLISLILVEIPSQALLFTLAFFCSYWTFGFTNQPAISGFVYFMYLLLSLFCNSFCHLMAALFPDETSAGYANSLFWVVLMMFSGVVVPHQSLNGFYRPWIFWADPMRYYFGGTVSSVLHGVRAQCLVSDMALFEPPGGGETCGEYMEGYIADHSGYLVNPDATAGCQYCPYSVGDDYLETLDFRYGDRWRDLAVFIGFCVTNVMLIFFVTWMMRVFIRRMRK